jgi:hypothetical protein
MRRFLICGLLFLLTACGSQKDKISLPRWLHDKIVQAERKSGSYVEVWVYKYRGQSVYLFLPDCCDRMSELYNEKGKLICKPGGGITGKGDGKCRNFIAKRKHGVLLWKPSNTID